MQIVNEIQELRNLVWNEKRAGRSVGFVPTMGALHAGHLALMQRAASENDLVIASVFVNPTQFDNADDLARYPRTFEEDSKMAAGAGVHFLFAPSVEEMYPESMETRVDVPKLSAGLIGKIRPGHFQGMASVVCKLLNIAAADRAYFGEKDYQQLAIIRRMVFDLNFPTEIIGVPTVREADGLAMSSRNRRLTAEDRQAAPVIFRAIAHAKVLVGAGETDCKTLQNAITEVIAKEPRAKLLSASIVDAVSLEEISEVIRPVAILLNVQFGEIILIDQGVISPPN